MNQRIMFFARTMKMSEKLQAEQQKNLKIPRG